MLKNKDASQRMKGPFKRIAVIALILSSVLCLWSILTLLSLRSHSYSTGILKIEFSGQLREIGIKTIILEYRDKTGRVLQKEFVPTLGKETFFTVPPFVATSVSSPLAPWTWSRKNNAAWPKDASLQLSMTNGKDYQFLFDLKNTGVDNYKKFQLINGKKTTDIMVTQLPIIQEGAQELSTSMKN